MREIRDQLRLHAAWVEEQMPPLVLPAEASRTAEPFEPVGRSGPKGWGSRRVWTVMAVAAALALLVAGLAVLRSLPGQPDPTDPAAGESGLVATAPDSVLLPRSTPEGLLATAVTTSAPHGRQQAGLEPTGPPITQLLGVDQQPKLEITIEPSRSGTSLSGGADQIVRGVPGQLLADGEPTVITSSDGGSIYDRPDTTNDRYSWYERGSFITARFVGLTAPETLDIIDAMQWASPDVTDGFAVTDDAGLGTLLPPTRQPSSGVGLEADVDYLVGPDDTTRLQLVTCPAGTGTCPGASFDYATAWLNGTRAADGSITASVDGRENTTGLTTRGFTLRIWPNGATAQVGFGEGVAVDPELGRGLLDDLAVTDGDGLAGLEEEISTGLAGLPVLAAADLPSGRVEVHGAGSLSVTCVAPTGAPLICGSPWLPYSNGAAPTTPINASSLVGGHWVVGASSTNPGPIAFASGDTIDFDHPAGPPLSGETTEVTTGGTTYQFGLVRVPDDVTGIMLTQSTPGSIGGGSVERPT